METGFTPIIGPFAHLSTTFGWVEGGERPLGGIVCPSDRASSWGDGDRDLDDRMGTGEKFCGPELEEGVSIVGGGRGRSRLVGECLGGGGVGNADLEETPEIGRSWLAVFKSISVLDTWTCCLSSLTIAVAILARFGFLARPLVGYNAAKKKQPQCQ